MSLVVRPFQPADAPTATDLLNAIIRTGGTTALQTPLSVEENTAYFLEGPKVLCCHVAVLDGQLVGFQSLGRLAELPEGWGDIATFAAEGLTGRGIGSALLAATRAKALALGLHHINARIRADNTGGLTYYSRMGFVDYHVDRAVPLADGTPVDRVFKQLVL